MAGREAAALPVKWPPTPMQAAAVIGGLKRRAGSDEQALERQGHGSILAFPPGWACFALCSGTSPMSRT